MTKQNFQDKDNLLHAISFGDIKKIKAAVKERKDKLAAGGSQANPLSDSFEYIKAAIKRGNFEVIDFLLKEENGAVLKEAGNIRPVKFLNRAADFAANAILRTASAGLFGAPSSVFQESVSKTDRYETALHLAVRNGQLDVLQKLILLNAINPAIKDGDGRTALDIAKKYAKKEVQEKMVSFLEDAQRIYHGSDAVVKKGLLAKMQDAIIDNTMKAKEVKKFPFGSAGSREDKPKSPSVESLEKAQKEFQKKIDEINTKKETQAKEIKDFLDRASGLAGLKPLSEESIRVFSDKYSLDVTTDYYKGGQDSAMHLAAKSGNFEAIKLLFEKHASVNLINSKGRTALDEAKFLDATKFPQKEDIIKFLTPRTTFICSPSATRVKALENSITHK